MTFPTLVVLKFGRFGEHTRPHIQVAIFMFRSPLFSFVFSSDSHAQGLLLSPPGPPSLYPLILVLFSSLVLNSSKTCPGFFLCCASPSQFFPCRVFFTSSPSMIILLHVSPWISHSSTGFYTSSIPFQQVLFALFGVASFLNLFSYVFFSPQLIASTNWGVFFFSRLGQIAPGQVIPLRSPLGPPIVCSLFRRWS